MRPQREPIQRGQTKVDALEDIVDRAIDYTDRILQNMPGYRNAAVAGLRNLRSNLAERAPDHPALGRLDTYLAGLGEDVSP